MDLIGLMLTHEKLSVWNLTKPLSYSFFCGPHRTLRENLQTYR